MILGNRKVTYRLLSEVLYTAGQAEFNRFEFAVVKTGSSAGAGGAAQAQSTYHGDPGNPSRKCVKTRYDKIRTTARLLTLSIA